MLVTLDPGLNCSGWAMFHTDGRLYQAGIAKAPRRPHPAAIDILCRQVEMAKQLRDSGTIPHTFHLLIAEWPRVYSSGKGRGDPNDLLPLAGVVGAFAALIGPREFKTVHVSDWKGQLDTEKHVKPEIYRVLTSEEVKGIEVCPDSLAHNMHDAIGIGLHHFGRLFPRVISRGSEYETRNVKTPDSRTTVRIPRKGT